MGARSLGKEAMMRIILLSQPWLVVLAVLLADSTAAMAHDPLALWNDGSAKAAILEFVGAVTEKGTLDKALDQADAKGWMIVDMKNDWKSVFSPR